MPPLDEPLAAGSSTPSGFHWIQGRPRPSLSGATFLQPLPGGGGACLPRAGPGDWALAVEECASASGAGRRAPHSRERLGLLRHLSGALRAPDLFEPMALGVEQCFGLSAPEARLWLDQDLFQLEQALELLRDGPAAPSRGTGLFVAHWSDGVGRLVARLARSLLAGEPVVLLPDPRLPFGAEALARVLFSAGLEDGGLALLWDDTRTLQRLALRDPRVAWLRAAGPSATLEELALGARPDQELALWPLLNRSLALPEQFDAGEAAREVLQQAYGRAATICGQSPGHVARAICPERRFAAFSEALLATLREETAPAPLPGLEADHASDLDQAWQLALDEGACPLQGLQGERVPSTLRVVTNVDPRMRIARERRPRPLLCLLRARNAAQAAELARELDATAPQASRPGDRATKTTLIPTPPTPEALTMSYAHQVHEILKRHQLADGFPFVFDLERSQGPWMVDARDGSKYLDLFTCFASWPVGYNHPRMSEPAFRKELDTAAANNPSNSDLYTESMARFVEAFATKVTPAGFPHHFWVSGGALAVENAMKVAFDWKAGKLGRRNFDDDANDLVVLHFRQAFHGRSGYTISVTNTDPTKIGLFPKFPWPRVHNPFIEFDLEGGIANDVQKEEARAIREIEAAFQKHKQKVACILIEPMQGEGGDNHFRPEFLARLRRFADEEEALLVFDEVQTGFFGSGSPWLWQKLGVRPDVVAFGKKTQICGLYAGPRVDEVPDNVFVRASRINSTWGGNLTDMVRSRQFIEIILGEKLHENVAAMGERFLAGLRGLAKSRGGIANVRGMGSLIAFTLESPTVRDEMLAKLREQRVLALKSGPEAIRFRMPFVIGAAEIDWALSRIEASLPAGSPAAR